MLTGPGSVSGSKPGPRITPGEDTAQFTPRLISCPCVTSASAGTKPRCSRRDDRDHHALPRAHDLPGIPRVGAGCHGAGGCAGSPAPSSCGGEAKGCPGAARHRVPVGSTHVYSSEGELMQFPSSRYTSGAAQAAGGKGVSRGSLEISSQASPMARTRPSNMAMPGVPARPQGIRGEGLGRRGFSGQGFQCRLCWQKGHDIFLRAVFKAYDL